MALLTRPSQIVLFSVDHLLPVGPWLIEQVFQTQGAAHNSPPPLTRTQFFVHIPWIFHKISVAGSKVERDANGGARVTVATKPKCVCVYLRRGAVSQLLVTLSFIDPPPGKRNPTTH